MAPEGGAAAAEHPGLSLKDALQGLGPDLGHPWTPWAQMCRSFPYSETRRSELAFVLTLALTGCFHSCSDPAGDQSAGC